MNAAKAAIAGSVLLIASIRVESEARQSPYHVEVACSATDPVGDKLCFAVKERIGASSLFALEPYGNGKTFLISLQTRDPLSSYTGTRNHATAASVAYLKHRNGILEFLSHDIVMCGVEGVWCNELMLSELALSIVDRLSDHL